MRRNGTGSAKSQTRDQQRLTPYALRQRSNEIEDGLGDAEAHDERRDGVLELRPNSCSPSNGNTVRSRPTMRRRSVDQHEQRELRKDSRASPSRVVTSVRPRLIRRFSANCAGCGGKSLRTKRRIRPVAVLERRIESPLESIVEPGLPLSPLPQAGTSKCAGKTSR